MQQAVPSREFDAATLSLDSAIAAFQQHGVIIVRNALANRAALLRVREYCDAYSATMAARIAGGDASVEAEFFRGGHGNRPYECVVGEVGFVAPVLPLLVMSVMWPLVRRLIGTDDLAVPLNHHILRRMFDSPEYLSPREWAPRFLPDDVIGNLHQDGVLVNPELPLTMWIALQDIDVGAASAVGFVPGPFAELFGFPVARQAIEEEFREFWRPAFRAGDVALFSRTTPHSTTRYGSATERFSIDLRVCALGDIPANLRNDLQVQVRQRDDQIAFGVLGMSGTPYQRTLMDILKSGDFLLPPL